MKARNDRGLLALACAGVVTLFGSTARAQIVNNGDGFDTHLFRPAMDSKGFFSVNGTDILGKNDVSFGLVIDYGRTLLRVQENGTGGSAQLIEHSFQGTAMFNYGIANLLSVGLTVPVNLMAGDERGSEPSVTGWSDGKLDSQTLGYLGLHAKLRITRVDRGPGLALGVTAGVPVTDAPKSAGADPSAWIWPQAFFEQRFGATGRFKIGLNAGVR
ncbi:MAG TPA: OmpA family protein, partial [Polyangiaceae bacterium]|nr:OmpA family protein [Polyangiaceae bacterium]